LWLLQVYQARYLLLTRAQSTNTNKFTTIM